MDEPMTTKAKNASMMGPMPKPSSVFFARDCELVATLRVTFLSKRVVALRRRAALFPLGMAASSCRQLMHKGVEASESR